VRLILRNSRSVFLSQGYVGFTLRNVARRVGISLSHLVYYFPSKAALFRSLIDDELKGQIDIWQKAAKETRGAPLARFDATMEAVLADSQRRETREFSYHLQAISTHDPFVATCKRKVYKIFVRSLEGLLQGINPRLSGTRLKSRAFMIASMLEGIEVMFGSHTLSSTELARAKAEFLDQVRFIALLP
jgi:AcrR family transcriptional regulator